MSIRKGKKKLIRKYGRENVRFHKNSYGLNPECLNDDGVWNNG